jgi:hypothetical protein
VHVFGTSKAGKSTLLVAAGSVVGFAREEDLVNFRLTDASTGEVPAQFTDLPLPMNELGLLKGSALERSQRIRDFSYGFAEGTGTTYSTLSAAGKTPRKIWRSIALSTGEEALEELYRAAGDLKMEGGSIRWIDLPALHGKAINIFDLPPRATIADRAWAQRQCGRLRKGCKRNHGVAIEHFLSHAIEDRRDLPDRLRHLTKQFVRKVTDSHDDAITRHLAGHFGFIYAVGILGVEFGTLPWTNKLVTRCIRRCFRDAKLALRTEDVILKEALGILRKRLRGEGIAKVKMNRSSTGIDLRRYHGYRSGKFAVIRAERFKAWFDDKRMAALALRALQAEGSLRSAQHQNSKSATGIIWAESQMRWPDGSRPRSIVIDIARSSLLGKACGKRRSVGDRQRC